MIQVHRIRNNHKTGKDFVQVPDKFIRKSVSLALDMFLELCCAADAERVLCNGRKPTKNASSYTDILAAQVSGREE